MVIPFSFLQKNFAFSRNNQFQIYNEKGIIISNPLPEQMNEIRVYESVSPEKDVDGINPINRGLLAMKSKHKKYFAPCTPLSVCHILDTLCKEQLENTQRELEELEKDFKLLADEDELQKVKERYYQSKAKLDLWKLEGFP